MNRLHKKDYVSGRFKENNMNQSNSDYKNTLRRSDDNYKIETGEGQYSQFH